MQKFQRLLWVGIAGLVLGLPMSVFAITAAPSLATPVGLSFAEIKITGDEFLVLQNNTTSTITDLSSYWLEDFNSVNPLAAGTSESSQQLPAIGLSVGQTLLLSSTTRPTCGAAVAGKLGLSLTDGGGFLELVQQTQTNGGAVNQTTGDVVSWSSGTSGNIPNVPSSTKDPAAAYYRYQTTANPAAYGWQLADLDSTNSCQLNVAVTVGGTTTKQAAPTDSLVQSVDTAPAVIIGVPGGDTASAGPSIPTNDVGLVAPEITELLPNPLGTGNDGSDEFVELYNPNIAIFDLTGFTLQVGTTTVHTFTFPNGVVLPAKSFVAFYSADTGLSLSNTSGQAALLDPFGKIVNQTDAYGSSKDGQAWALANDRWYWTTNPTPAAANVINQLAGSSSAKSKSSSAATKASKAKSSTGQVKGASTTAGNSGGTTGNAQDVALTTPIHPWTLALVAAAALLYGAYEYRLDLANRFVQFRKNRAARRVAG
ncbi:MAG TPA: lamin tail domain-containing protein [Patescibacteria group bacterium]|nr:lamin tail domain-containing protein [Patescibacteria group bacterium]